MTWDETIICHNRPKLFYILNKSMKKNDLFFVILKHSWIILLCVSVFICINVEFNYCFLPIESEQTANAINNVLLNLSYSYLAGAIFHIVVNVIPLYLRKRAMKPFIDNNIWLLSKYLRLCKTTPLNPLDFSSSYYEKDNEKEEYCNLFHKTNFFENYALPPTITMYNRINNYRDKIIDCITLPLNYREFLSEKQFKVLTDINKSTFIREEFDPWIEELEGENERHDNQKQYGESIFDNYMKIKTLL